MRLVVFHREQRPSILNATLVSSPFDFNRQVAKIRQRLLEPFSCREFNLELSNDVLRINFQFCFYGEPIEQSFEVKLLPWNYFSFWYRSGLQRVDVINEDFNCQNAMVAGLQHELADIAGAVGRILILDDVALLYLRGNLPDIPNFENVIVNRGEHSTWAFSRYSEKGRLFLDKYIQFRRDETQTYSLHDRVSDLKDQVELLQKEVKTLREELKTHARK